VDELAVKMSAQGHRVESLHGGMSQGQRERVLQKLKGASADLVIATDVAARGLDIERLTHVINFDVPSAPEAYVHRIGRVGRAGREGVAITLAEPRERRMVHNIEAMTRQRMELAQLPTFADLQARRLEITRAALRDILTEGDFDRFRDTVETLAEDFEPMEIAMAAIKMLHRNDPIESEEDKRAANETMRASVPMKRLFINVGRNAGVRPQDLVGAITNEAGIEGRDIGAIQIVDRFSLVELREDLIERVIEAMTDKTIKGQAVSIRIDQMAHKAGPGPGPGPAPFRPKHRAKPARARR
jgi:ATP-dependent RNA helicase DeaD